MPLQSQNQQIAPSRRQVSDLDSLRPGRLEGTRVASPSQHEQGNQTEFPESQPSDSIQFPSKHRPPPENAERELKRAYNRLMESGAVWFWQRDRIPLIHLHSLAPEWPAQLYRTAMALYRSGDRLQAERWARSCRHYSTALWHEAKLSWLRDSQVPKDLPELPNAQVEYHLHESIESTRDLIQDLEHRKLPSPPGVTPGSYAAQWIPAMIRVARMHLDQSGSPSQPSNLTECEHLKAAEEWARSAEGISVALQSLPAPSSLKRGPEAA